MSSSEHSSSNSNFRYDINGLRAIAVLSVLLFHFNVIGFAGGFIGVDVFFVISGFLMTGIIVKGLENLHVGTGGNSIGPAANFIWKFYLARARRIIPALLVLVAVLLVVGWFVLPQGDYRQLAIHGGFAVAFLSNIRFWQEAGYFDAASHEKWLLHTWTLSVEWQFYLLLPLVLLLIWRLRPHRYAVLAVIMGAIAASLYASVVWTSRDPSGAFFLLPTRIWQMLAGGLVFLLADKFRVSSTHQRLLEIAGVSFIGASIALFDAESYWPGINALLPVVGTMFLLLAARQSRWARNGLVQWLGLSSYSLYLWHWPVFVGLVYLELSDQVLAIVCGLVLSLILGGISYHLVENPSRRWLSRKGPVLVPASIATSVLAVAVFASVIFVKQGVPGRLPPKVEIAAGEAFNFNQRRDECHSMGGPDFPWCTYGGENVQAVVVGDSHASTVVTAVVEAAESSGGGGL